MRGSQPPQGGLLGPAKKGRSGRPVAAPRATGGRHLPCFFAQGVGGGSAITEGRGCEGWSGLHLCGGDGVDGGGGRDRVGEVVAGKAQRGP